MEILLAADGGPPRRPRRGPRRLPRPHGRVLRVEPGPRLAGRAPRRVPRLLAAGARRHRRAHARAAPTTRSRRPRAPRSRSTWRSACRSRGSRTPRSMRNAVDRARLRQASRLFEGAGVHRPCGAPDHRAGGHPAQPRVPGGGRRRHEGPPSTAGSERMSPRQRRRSPRSSWRPRRRSRRGGRRDRPRWRRLATRSRPPSSGRAPARGPPRRGSPRDEPPRPARVRGRRRGRAAPARRSIRSTAGGTRGRTSPVGDHLLRPAPRPPRARPGLDGFLDAGARLVAAGYALYGPRDAARARRRPWRRTASRSTARRAFLLTAPELRIPASTGEFAIDASQRAVLGGAGASLRPGVPRRSRGTSRDGLQHALDRVDLGRRSTASSCGEASFVSPARPGRHVSGGCACSTRRARSRSSSSRPEAPRTPRAGGSSTSLRPTLHQRIAVFLGSRDEVERLARYHREHDARGPTSPSGRRCSAAGPCSSAPRIRCSRSPRAATSQPTRGRHVHQAPDRRDHRLLRRRHDLRDADVPAHLPCARGSSAVLVEGDAFHRYDRARDEAPARGGRRRGATTGSATSGRRRTCSPSWRRCSGATARAAAAAPHATCTTTCEAAALGQEPGTFTPWQDVGPGTDLLFYEGLHGGIVDRRRRRRAHVDLLVGVVPIINLEWIQKLHRDKAARGYSTEAVVDTILRRMPDYVNHICPQFSRTHVNFQRVPTVDTSNPFIARDIPTRGRELPRHPLPRTRRGIDFPYLLSMLHDSFMSRPNTIVCRAGRWRSRCSSSSRR